MSRAFVKESDQDLSSLPELEISPHPNFVTASGHDALVRRVRELEAERTAARSAGDEARLARVARDLRYFQARRDSARLVVPAGTPDAVRFGTRVELAYADGRQAAFRLVGEDESDPGAGLIAYVAPLARALMGLQVGDELTVGGVPATIVAISA